MSTPERNGVGARALIPGAYERRPVMPRQAGTMSGPASGSLQPPSDPLPMDDATRAAHRKEGGETAATRRGSRREDK
jgi:hypothetical protein